MLLESDLQQPVAFQKTQEAKGPKKDKIAKDKRRKNPVGIRLVTTSCISKDTKGKRAKKREKRQKTKEERMQLELNLQRPVAFQKK